jgi:uncharacterized circularly permuted ATP-grasp superfamily protein
MKTITGLRRVDVIYRRIDDDFIDPEAFRPDSALGVPGLMRAWKAGNVGIANAPGAGVADDKVVYAFVPKIIKYYLDRGADHPQRAQLPVHVRGRADYVLANLDKLVVKPANESGGYGMLIGPRATPGARPVRRTDQGQSAQLHGPADPGAVHRAHRGRRPPGAAPPRPAPLHVAVRQALRTTGGLTRVAMKAGSLVVNSSQGGGSKDTWIVDTEED